ncbi:immune inhibitor A domain-containing protein [Longispora sp. NPDC051575]|uniref:immune inhibitor A domain-containing protein n=1 Tax=Longispora sp. NPDC051575 TaxID=3154943 RepID=UPI00343CA296
MRRRTRVLVAGVASGLLAAGMASAAVQASPGGPAAQPPAAEEAHQHRAHELMTPKMAQERAEKQQALNLIVSDPSKLKQRGESRGVQLPNGKWVQWGTPKTAQIFTLLAEYGDATPDGGTPGPAHNAIPQPDRTKDNSTIWQPNFTQEYFQKLLFAKSGDSMSDFYLRQSSGRYTVDGEVTPWVKLPANTTRYGKNDPTDLDNEAKRYGALVKDTVEAWVLQQKAAGRTDAQIKAHMAKFDVWDRDDFDGDGNFDEPDGYLDHVQIIHSGEGEEAGGGDDLVWSHSWSAFGADAGKTGPAGNKQGGVAIGDTGIWVSRYTTEPENGGLGVFAHEYGHDIGLPDYYDTQGGDNGTSFWTLMSAGSWLNAGKNDIGSRPGYMGPNEKLFLGWLDYDVVEANDKNAVSVLGAAAGGSVLGLKQATMVKLPVQKLTKEYTKPFAGTGEYFSGDADNIQASLRREIDLTGTTTASVTAKAHYATEKGYDFVEGQVSTDNGATWIGLGKREGASAGWVDLTYDLTPYVGKKILFQFFNYTDGGLHYEGLFLDNISIVKNGAVAFSDDAETDNGGWTSKGFTRFDGTLRYEREHFYLVENRQYVGYDSTLKTGPYNFGFRNTKADWVERYAFNPGIVVWYINGAYGDNNTTAHPGYGQALPVDARPGLITPPGQTPLQNSKGAFDGSFSRKGIPAVTFHKNGSAITLPARPGIAVFDDTNVDKYWIAGDATSPQNGWNSTKVSGTGVRIEILLDGNGSLVPAIIKITRK